MSQCVAIAGIGITTFGRHESRSGQELLVDAVGTALRDAGVDWRDIDIAAGGSMSAGNADSAVRELGLSGLPFINVFNGCATGGSALMTAKAMITSGQANMALAVGFDKHPRGAFALDPEDWGMGRWYGQSGLMQPVQYFALKAQRYMHDHGISEGALATAIVRASQNGSLNPTAWRRQPTTVEEVLGSPMVCPPLTQRMICSPGAGAVAVVLSSPSKTSRADTVWLRSVAFRTRRFGSFSPFSPSLPLEQGTPTATEAAAAAFEEAGIEPSEVQIAQLQDTDAASEAIHMAETGLCGHGEQERLLLDGATEIGGRLPINTDGGCIANGEPVGASGLRQVYETVLQLRGRAGDRQVPNRPKVGFTQVYGAPGVSACAVLTR